MTADIELLPLPEPMGVLGTRGKDAAEAWCRANVAHATEPLKAEIEALQVRADAMAGEAIKHEARAERLAEALRGLLVDAVRRGMPEDDHSATEAQTALRDHDQEVGNG